MDTNTDSYDMVEHTHRFATWTAAKAAQSSNRTAPKDNKKEGKLGNAEVDTLITAVKLRSFVKNPETLPGNPADMDVFHEKRRNVMVRTAETTPGIRCITHGVAAKIINTYFKTALVCANCNDPAIRHLHPPIDSILLKNIASHWKLDIARNVTWTAMDSCLYQEIISAIRTHVSGQPLWKVEAFWNKP